MQALKAPTSVSPTRTATALLQAIRILTLPALLLRNVGVTSGQLNAAATSDLSLPHLPPTPVARLMGASHFTSATAFDSTSNMIIVDVKDIPTGAATAVLTNRTDVAHTVTKPALLSGFTDVDDYSPSETNLVASTGTIDQNVGPSTTDASGAHLTDDLADGEGGTQRRLASR